MALVGRHAVATVAVISWKQQQNLDGDGGVHLHHVLVRPPAETPRDGSEPGGVVTRADVQHSWVVPER